MFGMWMEKLLRCSKHMSEISAAVRLLRLAPTSEKLRAEGVLKVTTSDFAPNTIKAGWSQLVCLEVAALCYISVHWSADTAKELVPLRLRAKEVERLRSCFSLRLGMALKQSTGLARRGWSSMVDSIKDVAGADKVGVLLVETHKSMADITTRMEAAIAALPHVAGVGDPSIITEADIKVVDEACTLLVTASLYKEEAALDKEASDLTGSLADIIERARGMLGKLLGVVLGACAATLEAEQLAKLATSHPTTPWLSAHLVSKAFARLRPLSGDACIAAICGLMCNVLPLFSTLAEAKVFKEAEVCHREIAGCLKSGRKMAASVESDHKASEFETEFGAATKLRQYLGPALGELEEELKSHTLRLLECDLAGCGNVPRKVLEDFPQAARGLVEAGVLVHKMPQLSELTSEGSKEESELWDENKLLEAVMTGCSYTAANFDLCIKLRSDAGEVRDALLKGVAAQLVKFAAQLWEAYEAAKTHFPKYEAIIGHVSRGGLAEEGSGVGRWEAARLGGWLSVGQSWGAHPKVTIWTRSDCFGWSTAPGTARSLRMFVTCRTWRRNCRR